MTTLRRKGGKIQKLRSGILAGKTAAKTVDFTDLIFSLSIQIWTHIDKSCDGEARCQF